MGRWFLLLGLAACAPTEGPAGSDCDLDQELPYNGRDDDCDPSTPDDDLDGDGASGIVEGDERDCDDEDPTIGPPSPEVCDDADIDEDCDGLADDDDPDAVGQTEWYLDSDGDGWGVDTQPRSRCDPTSGYTATVGGDCDDARAEINPGAAEICDDSAEPDPVDEDCDGLADELDPDLDAATWYPDADGDGWGVGLQAVERCGEPAGHAADAGDCDDEDPAVNPDAIEICNGGIDDDCDRVVDDDDPSLDTTTAEFLYADEDGDRYGDASDPGAFYCLRLSEQSDDNTDCDDTRRDVNPGAQEVCDDLDTDEDCDGLADDDDPSVLAESMSIWAPDLDGDGYGDMDAPVSHCDAPSGYTGVGEDCDDTDDAINPDAHEDCVDGIDNDCSGTIDDCMLDGEHSLTEAWLSLYGESAGHTAGCAVSIDGDVDADGYSDVVVGAYYASGVYLLYGPVSGAHDLGAADVMISGTVSSRDGYAVAAGDLNGDGYADIALGGPDDASYQGAAYVFFGPLTADTTTAAADASYAGAAASDYLGYALAAAGDLDGDGVGDLAIGAYADDTGASSAGAVYLAYGPPTGGALPGDVILGAASSDYAGASVIGAGDLDGDGLGDLLVGAYRNDDAADNAGAAYVVLGPATGSTDVADAYATLTGEVEDDEAGLGLAAGDVDGDGYRDLLVGAPGVWLVSDRAVHGAAYLVLGPASGAIDLGDADLQIAGTGADYDAGERVATGDLDADGYDDLIVGAAGASPGGEVGVMFGPATGSYLIEECDAVYSGVVGGSEAGSSLSAGGDVNGDGFSDLLIGAQGDAPDDYGAGGAYLVLGQAR